ncbi:MAG: aquaporin family protein [Verrucomicrobiota bacterium]|nr:aquaporin family protein [Verrucomicrobiota bacterium]
MFPKYILGEILGTFLLVFFGCSAVAGAVTLNAFEGVFQIAFVWGLGLVIAIQLTEGFSQAHFNPAVTFAMFLFRGMKGPLAMAYILCQFAGAFMAASLVFIIFREPLSAYEQSLHIVRGAPGSEATAMVFGEFFPNPGGKPLGREAGTQLSIQSAFIAELVGIGLLTFAIFGFDSPRMKAQFKGGIPYAIGATLAVLICIFGPLTMACFNPARDLGPRVFSSIAGWGALPFKVNGNGWWLVYLIAPLCGGLLGGWLGKSLFQNGQEH